MNCTFYLVSDCYLGLDQEFNVPLSVQTQADAVKEAEDSRRSTGQCDGKGNKQSWNRDARGNSQNQRWNKQNDRDHQLKEQDQVSKDPGSLATGDDSIDELVQENVGSQCPESGRFQPGSEGERSMQDSRESPGYLKPEGKGNRQNRNKGSGYPSRNQQRIEPKDVKGQSAHSQSQGNMDAEQLFTGNSKDGQTQQKLEVGGPDLGRSKARSGGRGNQQYKKRGAGSDSRNQSRKDYQNYQNQGHGKKRDEARTSTAQVSSRSQASSEGNNKASGNAGSQTKNKKWAGKKQDRGYGAQRKDQSSEDPEAVFTDNAMAEQSQESLVDDDQSSVVSETQSEGSSYRQDRNRGSRNRSRNRNKNRKGNKGQQSNKAPGQDQVGVAAEQSTDVSVGGQPMQEFEEEASSSSSNRGAGPSARNPSGSGNWDQQSHGMYQHIEDYQHPRGFPVGNPQMHGQHWNQYGGGHQRGGGVYQEGYAGHQYSGYQGPYAGYQGEYGSHQGGHGGHQGGYERHHWTRSDNQSRQGGNNGRHQGGYERHHWTRSDHQGRQGGNNGRHQGGYERHHWTRSDHQGRQGGNNGRHQGGYERHHWTRSDNQSRQDVNNSRGSSHDNASADTEATKNVESTSNTSAENLKMSVEATED